MAVISNELKWTQIWSDLAIEKAMKKQMKPIYYPSRLFQENNLKAQRFCGRFIVEQILKILNVTVGWSKAMLTGDFN